MRRSPIVHGFQVNSSFSLHSSIRLNSFILFDCITPVESICSIAQFNLWPIGYITPATSLRIHLFHRPVGLRHSIASISPFVSVNPSPSASSTSSNQFERHQPVRTGSTRQLTQYHNLIRLHHTIPNSLHQTPGSIHAKTSFHSFSENVILIKKRLKFRIAEFLWFHPKTTIPIYRLRTLCYCE